MVLDESFRKLETSETFDNHLNKYSDQSKPFESNSRYAIKWELAYHKLKEVLCGTLFKLILPYQNKYHLLLNQMGDTKCHHVPNYVINMNTEHWIPLYGYLLCCKVGTNVIEPCPVQPKPSTFEEIGT